MNSTLVKIELKANLSFISEIEGKAAPVSNPDNGFKYLHIIQMEDANSLDAVQL